MRVGRHLLPGFALLFAVALALAACGSGTEFVLMAGETLDAEALGFALDGEDVTDTAPTINVRAGNEVTITLTNVHGQYSPLGGLHDFAVIETSDDLTLLTATGRVLDQTLWGSLTPRIETGQSATVTFVPDQPGTYLYLCTIPGHADQGMVGSFIVEP